MASVYSGFLPELDLEDIKISNIPLNVIDRKDAMRVKILFITGFRCDGIIGWDLLSHFDFTIDYKHKQLTLRKPIAKNNQRKNLFWCQIPIVKFYTKNNYPLLCFFDSGSGSTSFSKTTIPRIFGIDTNNLKKRTERVHGVNEWIKINQYKYSDFECYTLLDDEIIYL